MAKRIILVEDEPEIHELVKMILEGTGFELDSAYTGDTGLSKILRNKYDLVLLNIMMPGMDGFEVCREIRNRKIQVPIIFESVRGDQKTIDLAREVGGDAYVVKPFEPSELFKFIKKILARDDNDSRPEGA